MESSASSASKVSVPFLAYMFGVGIGLIVALGYAGYAAWPFLLTITIGAAAQLLFRIIKRAWKNSLNLNDGSSRDGTFNLKHFRNLLWAYIAMVAVSALWYGVGWGIRWLSA